MRQPAPYIRQIPPGEQPLSADVFIISGNKRTYVYDVGNNDEALRAINSLPEKPVVILSHFHPDHTGNIDKISCEQLYGGALTCKKLGKGTVVSGSVTIDDGVFLEITHCPSPHAKGSLILTVNHEYTLLGDLYYTKDKQNGAVPNMLHLLRRLDTRYFVPSHERENVREKEALISELEEYFCKEKK